MRKESVHTRSDRSQFPFDLRLGLGRSQTRLDRSQTRLDRSQTRLDRSQTRLDRSQTRLDRSQTRLDRSSASFRSMSASFRSILVRSRFSLRKCSHSFRSISVHSISVRIRAFTSVQMVFHLDRSQIDLTHLCEQPLRSIQLNVRFEKVSIILVQIDLRAIVFPHAQHVQYFHGKATHFYGETRFLRRSVSRVSVQKVCMAPP